ncbi:MAG: hypothetical protein ABI655_07480 [Phenylobacterium sp.]
MSNDSDQLARIGAQAPPRRDDILTKGAVAQATSGWWFAAVLAVLAVTALIFLLSRETRHAELQARGDQGSAPLIVDDATVNAEMAAAQATQASQVAVASTAGAREAAAVQGRAAANQTAQNAGEAASDAAATVPASPQP